MEIGGMREAGAQRSDGGRKCIERHILGCVCNVFESY